MTMPRFVVQHMRDTNNVYEFTGDYSSASTTAFYRPEHGSTVTITNLIIYIEDNGTIDVERYGALSAALTNGISVNLSNWDGQIINLTADENIKTNGDWTKYAFDVERKAWGVGNEYIRAVWNFEAFNKKLRLEGREGEALNIVLNDDFSGLVKHNFLIQGIHQL